MAEHDRPRGRERRISGAAPRYLGFRDVAVFVVALPMAQRAQRVRSRPLTEVVAGMAVAARRRGLEPGLALRAALRACSRSARWFGGLDTCLTRSLVAGALLAADHDVVLHVGFRPGTEEVSVDGHAWLTVDGDTLDVATPDEAAAPYAGALEIPFSIGQGDTR